MKRKIKLRAWIETGNETDDYVEPMTIQQMIHSKESTFNLEQLNDLVDFEQFTGLTDVNGKEIYEGDIVEITTQYWGMLGNRYEVKLKQGAFCVKYVLLSVISPSISVIGNMHENPELLEGKQ